MQARQVEADEEARLALLTQQAGIKLTLTPEVPVIPFSAHMAPPCSAFQ